MRADFVSQGMNHAEGGWPKVLGSHESTRRNQLRNENYNLNLFQDINPNENDQTMRFRKKIEKDEK